jgi:biofilm PGA synthesis lipoprotein PgaB
MLSVTTLALLLSASAPAPGPHAGDGRFLALCYHDVVSGPTADLRAVEERQLVAQLEFLRGQGAHFLTVDELLAARQGGKLPPRSVLLTFDDGCRSFRRKVLPLLRTYGIPAVLSVVTAWTEEVTDADCEDGVMSWDEIADVARSGLVEVASHSHDLHVASQINPLGSTAPAAGSRLHDPKTGGYETADAYRRRIARDLRLSARVLQAKLGRRPRVLTWPYGAYTDVAVEEGRGAGFDVLLTIRDDLDGGVASASDLTAVPRRMLQGQPTVEAFARDYWRGGPSSGELRRPVARRAIHADLDMLYDPDPGITRRNVDRFVDRVASLKPNTVYLQAFADDAGTGNVSSVYFPNRVLPMKADLFSFVARALEVREIQVVAWMPALSVVLPDPEEGAALAVRERHRGETRPSSTSYRRLSPFSEEARRRVASLFEDLAAAAPIEGVLFQDDAFLAPDEDFHPAARPALRELGIDPAKPLSELQAQAWTERKTRALIAWTDALMSAVRRHRPGARASRTVYAPVLLDPDGERRFAQSYRASLAAYDEVVVMAYPLMEEVASPSRWLRRLVAAARAEPGGLDRTVFKVQTVDWNEDGECVPPDRLATWVQALLDEGARHLAYYPDNVFDDCPSMAASHAFISTEAFPLPPYGSGDAR